MPQAKDDWILAAIKALDKGGLEAVRIEPIARDLSVTKGSFYWHFADRAELLEGVLAAWERATRELIARVRPLASPKARVLGLFDGVWRPASGPVDGGVFAWAALDALVAKRVSAVESRRVEFIREQLSAAGLDGVEAGRRSHVAYLTMMAWIERAGRGRGASEPRVFGQYVLDLVLAPGANEPTMDSQ
jgi:AcrR family transcriptional regulator